MDRQEVDMMLADYREFSGRCKHLEQAISDLAKQIESAQMEMVDNAVLNGKGIDGMPHGTTMGNPTENLAAKLADGFIPQEILEMQAELRGLESELLLKRKTVCYVEAWLNGLNEREQWIITNQVIDKMYWREIMLMYRLQFGEEYTRDTLKRVKTRALEKIYKIAG